MTLQQKKERLESLGYSVNMPINADYLTISGTKQGKYSTKYYNAKKAKAKTITETLIKLGFDAKAELDIYDDFYNFYIF